MRTPGPSGGRNRSIRPGAGREAARGILGVDPQLDRVPAARAGAAAVRERSPAAIRTCSRTRSIPSDRLGDRVLDLQPRVQLDEGERAVRPDEELERAGVAVADVPAGALGGGLHLLAQLVVERRRR